MNTDQIKSIYDELSSEITRAIDNEVLCNIMAGNGWTKVSVNCVTDTQHVEILDWIKQNIKGQYRGQYDLWAFESKADAILFKLCWTH